MAGTLTPEKAKEILRDGTANGRPLSTRQKGFFGARAAGKPIRGVKRGKAGRTRPR
jgi:hypothetical protein